MSRENIIRNMGMDFELKGIKELIFLHIIKKFTFALILCETGQRIEDMIILTEVAVKGCVTY